MTAKTQDALRGTGPDELREDELEQVAGGAPRAARPPEHLAATSLEMERLAGLIADENAAQLHKSLERPDGPPSLLKR